MRAVNRFNNKVYFISVANVRSQIKVPVSVSVGSESNDAVDVEVDLPPLELEIRLQAAIYEHKKNFLKQMLSKPIFVVNLDDPRQQISEEEFTDIVREVVENERIENVLKNDGISETYEKYGLQSVDHDVWSLFYLSKIKHTFVLKPPEPKDEFPRPS